MQTTVSTGIDWPPGIVWLASYPKSGNTWVRLLFSHLLVESEQPQDINSLPVRENIASSIFWFGDMTLLDATLLRFDEVLSVRPLFHDADAAESPEARFIKTHDAYSRGPDGTPLLGRAGRAALYVVRDPRDVVVSYARFLGNSVDDIITELNDPAHRLGPSPRQFKHWLWDWSGHVQSWLDQTDLPVKLMRYEDLLANPAATLGQALHFLGVDVDQDRINRAVHHTSFAELQRQERENGFREFRRQGLFFRKGVAGEWREVLTPAQVQAIERAHGETMLRLGYQVECAT